MAADSRSTLAQVLGDLAITMQEIDAESTLRSIVDGAVQIVPGARWAGISMINRRQIERRAPSDQLVVELDEASRP